MDLIGDFHVPQKDVDEANRIRKKIVARYETPQEMMSDMHRRDPGAFAMLQHYVSQAFAQDRDTAVMLMCECVVSTWALIREIRSEVRPKESLN